MFYLTQVSVAVSLNYGAVWELFVTYVNADDAKRVPLSSQSPLPTCRCSKAAGLMILCQKCFLICINHSISCRPCLDSFSSSDTDNLNIMQIELTHPNQQEWISIPILSQIYMSVWRAAPQSRPSLQRLLGTWQKFFPQDILRRIGQYLAEDQVKQVCLGKMSVKVCSFNSSTNQNYETFFWSSIQYQSRKMALSWLCEIDNWKKRSRTLLLWGSVNPCFSTSQPHNTCHLKYCILMWA